MRVSSILTALGLTALALIGALTVAPLSAAPGQTSRAAATPAPAPRLTKEAVDSWLDQLLIPGMREGNIPGGVVVVVKDGKILTERGYGYADKALKIPVDPRTTLFRPGSISKAFTWTAVMQLVEQGKIDLDADINRYLDFRIPPRNGKFVTMRTMMTHTAGFEESMKDIIGADPPPPLGAFLKRWVPEIIYTPGTRPAYSNYASTLAGYVVERVSGERFEDYMDNHVFAQLGMAHSTFRQPLPARFTATMSRGYLPDSGQPRYFENVAFGPAGAMSATGDDMARFMIAHLESGQSGGAQLLRPETVAAMHTIQPKIYPALNGMALGLYEHSRNGHRILAHNGGTQFFHSDLHLFLDDRVGIFISFNSPGIDDAATTLHDRFFHGFADRFFPKRTPLPAPTVDQATAIAHAKLMAGSWEANQHSESSVWRLAGLLGPLTITANADGTIGFPVPHHGVLTWREISPFVWRNTQGPDRIQAIVRDGKPAMLGLDMAPPAGFTPIPAWRSPSWVLPALGMALLVLLLTGLSWPVTALVRWRRKVALRYQGPAAVAYHAVRGLSLGAVFAFVGLIGTLVMLASSYDRLSTAFDPLLTAMKIVTTLAVTTAFLAISYDAIRFRGLRSGWFGRLWSILLVASSFMLLWTAVVFHVVNFSAYY